MLSTPVDIGGIIDALYIHKMAGFPNENQILNIKKQKPTSNLSFPNFVRKFPGVDIFSWIGWFIYKI